MGKTSRVAIALLLAGVVCGTGCGDARRRPPVGASAAPSPAAQKPATPAPAAAKSGESTPAAPSASPAAVSSEAPAGVPVTVEGQATLTLDAIVKATVKLEDLSPEVPAEPEPEGMPSLTSAVFSVNARGLSLDVAFEKRVQWKERSTGQAPNARWVLADAHSGLVLAEGRFEIPVLCTCSAGANHVEGDVLITHETTFVLDLPRHRDDETLKIYDASGKELDAWSLDLPR
jgi:hypothetical protein